MVTPGSWWKNVKTGQRLVAPRYTSFFKSETIRTSNNWGRFSKKSGLGQQPNVSPYFAEGEGQYLRWLADEELKALHKPYRPDGEGRVPLPKWLTHAEMNDFILDKDSSNPLWCAFEGARGSLVALAGMCVVKTWDITIKKYIETWSSNWGVERYTLIFIESSEAIKRLIPKYNRPRPTSWDKLDGDHF